MTVNALISWLKKCKHKHMAQVIFYVDKSDTEYDIKEIGQFGVVPDVTIQLKKK